jgi:tyrosyl-DNA phosphodiesterase 1
MHIKVCSLAYVSTFKVLLKIVPPKMILGLWRAKSTPLGTLAPSTSNGKGKHNAPIEIETEESEEDEDGDIQVVEPEAAGWLYVGSHNFTPSAW